MLQLQAQQTTKADSKRFNTDVVEQQLLWEWQNVIKKPFANDIEAKRIASEFANGLEKKRGFLLMGVCGNGKTSFVMAVRMMLNMWINKGYIDKSRDENGCCEYGLYFYHAGDLAEMAVNNNIRYHNLKRRKLLAIDDFGDDAAEIMNYGTVVRPISDIISYRYSENLFTIISTNLTPQNIREKYGERIADRLKEMMNVIIFRDGSYRK